MAIECSMIVTLTLCAANGEDSPHFVCAATLYTIGEFDLSIEEAV
jgi:hypothetical protein